MKKSSTLLFVFLLLLLGACSNENEGEQEDNQNDTEQEEDLEEKDNKENLDPATGLFMEFIKENKDSDRIAFLATWNDEPIAEMNTNLALPLASVVKIIIAIEFASQAEEGKIDLRKRYLWKK